MNRGTVVANKSSPKAWEPGDQTPFERAAALGKRIQAALDLRQLHAYDLAEQIEQPRRTVSFWILGKTEPLKRQMLAIAEACNVDPRWLATGHPSPAAAAALEAIHPDVVYRLPKLPADAEQLITFVHNRLRVIRQPDFGPGVCRYCLCVTEQACEGGCEWVDLDCTICSACLYPERTHG